MLEVLGYRQSAGWLDAEGFNYVNGPRSSLRLAKTSMNVFGAFGTWQASVGSAVGKRFAPLLYVATASDAKDAKRLHCRVWSQGLVPLLIIVTPKSIYISEGFGFSHGGWHSQVVEIPVSSLRELGVGAVDMEPLKRLHALRLSSALAWRDFQLNSENRVDRRLLVTLRALSKRLAEQSKASVMASNALIGRFLYFYILRDRGVIADAWLSKFGGVGVFEKRTPDLTALKVWCVFDALDELLNGTIFPAARQERHAFGDADVRLLRDCIKLGDVLTDEAVQLSFVDFDLSSLQTETLSAIYEQFLESEDSQSKRRDGVFYTPPFLVDFVLDRVEDEVPLNAGRRVIDCTAGSGVFIVGAYRRIIEAELLGREAPFLSAHELRRLLLNCIFGVEKNPSAHAVAAFSLYLTMLDYVEAADIQECLRGDATEKLFPPLREENLICCDVFQVNEPERAVRKFDVVVGNPPWQYGGSITRQFDCLQEKYGDRVDSGEAAEHAMWWALDNFAEPNSGIVALVLPTKSLVGPSADKFPQAVAGKVEVAGVANLSHLRYTLFSHARQAACMLMVRNRPPTTGSKPWIYSPSRAHLLGPTGGAPWLITFDRSHVEHCRQREMIRNVNGDSWFSLLMLKAIDRYIKRYLVDSISVEKATTLRSLLRDVGAELRKGGSPTQTGLDSYRLWGADKNKHNDVRAAPGVTVLTRALQLSNSAQFVLEGFEAVDVNERPDSTWLTTVAPNFTRRFSGDCLLIPRSMVNISFAKWPVAFNSSLNAIFFSEGAEPEEAKARRRFLFALGLFLESSVANYLFALFGKLWILDRTRLEKNDILDIPVPFFGVHDSLVDSYLNARSEAEQTRLVCERFGLRGLLLGAVHEYTTFRHQFEDGGVPANSSENPTSEEMQRYQTALMFALRPIDAESPEILIDKISERNLPIRVTVTLSYADKSGVAPPSSYFATGAVSEGTSLHVQAGGHVTLFKPSERFRWTVESAFADGNRVIEELMNEARGVH
ncbi:MAG: N-6 DNA methylase [Rubrivivax sp.]